MTYRDDIEAAHHRIAELEESRRVLAEELEAVKQRAADERRQASVEKSAAHPPTVGAWPTTARLALTALFTLVGYVAVILLYDGPPHRPEPMHIAAWIGAALPALASARFWWTRGRDRTWMAINVSRALIVAAIASGAFTSFSRFGQAFVFFWWAPLASVGLLLAEIAAAHALEERPATTTGRAVRDEKERRVRVGGDDRRAPLADAEHARDREEGDAEEARAERTR
jgi:hypothetical protein